MVYSRYVKVNMNGTYPKRCGNKWRYIYLKTSLDSKYWQFHPQALSLQFASQFHLFYIGVSQAIEEVLLLFQYLYTERQSCALRRRSGRAARNRGKKTKRQCSTLDTQDSNSTTQPYKKNTGSDLVTCCGAETDSCVITANHRDLYDMRHETGRSARPQHGLRARLYLWLLERCPYYKSPFIVRNFEEARNFWARPYFIRKNTLLKHSVFR